MKHNNGWKLFHTSLWDDSSCDNHDNGPVEFGFECWNNFLANFAVCSDGSEGDLDNEDLAKGSILLFVLNQLSAVNPDLAQMFLQGSVVELELGEYLGGFILKFGRLGLSGGSWVNKGFPGGSCINLRRPSLKFYFLRWTSLAYYSPYLINELI